MKQSFCITFFIVTNINSILLTLIGIHSLICGSMWLGVAFFILGLCGLSMMDVLIKKTIAIVTRFKSDENGNITSITVDTK